MNIENSKLARSLFSKTSKLEQELAALLKRKSPVDRSITQLRNQIRDNYEQVLFLDLVFAQSKDIDQLLWKCVFYKAIEEFRKIIQKYQKSQTPEKEQESRDKLAKATTSFLAFLEDASKYYESLFTRLSEKYQECKTTNQEDLCSIYITILQKMNITLGDLARYSQLHSDSNSKDWSKAVSYYTRALDLNPSNGNSHNQLAVIATYKNDDFEGCYRYFRSLSVKKPFVSARENLILLFERNRLRYVKISQRNQQQQENQHNRRNSKKKFYKEVIKSNDEIHDRFLAEFVRLHGIIFTKINVDTFDTIKTDAFNDFVHLLNNNFALFTEDLLLKMMIMNIFSLDYTIQHSNSDVFQNALSLAVEMFDAIAAVATSSKTIRYLSSLNVMLQFIKNSESVCEAVQEAFWKSVAAMANCVVRDKHYCNKKQQVEELLLPEDTELLGFKPLDLPEVKGEGAKGSTIETIRVARYIQLVDILVAKHNASIRSDNGKYYAVVKSSSQQFIQVSNGEALASRQFQFEEDAEEEEEASSFNQQQVEEEEIVEEEEEANNDDLQNNHEEEEEEVFMFTPEKENKDPTVSQWESSHGVIQQQSLFSGPFFAPKPSPNSFSAFGNNNNNSPWSAAAVSTPPNSFGKVIERPRANSASSTPNNHLFNSWGSQNFQQPFGMPAQQPQPQQYNAQFMAPNAASASNFGSFGMFQANENSAESAGWSNVLKQHASPSNGASNKSRNVNAFIS